MMMNKHAFFLGKGGVGKTSLSAAFALGLARLGKKTLIASIDPAHNLGDVYSTKLENKPKFVEANLDAMEVDVSAWVKKYLDDSRSDMASTYGYSSTLGMDSFFDILKYSPGTEEYAMLWAIEDIHDKLSTVYDVIIFDTPPTALSLRFLAMPNISMRWIHELSSMRKKILEKRQTLTKLNPESPVASSCVDKNDDKVYIKLGSIQTRLQKLSSIFQDQSFVSVIINMDELSVAEAKRIQTELKRIDIPLAAICVNKCGMSKANWELDHGLSNFPVFNFDFVPTGLQSKDDLLIIKPDNLIEAFLKI